MKTYAVTINGVGGYTNTLYTQANDETDAISQVKVIRRYQQNHTFTAKIHTPEPYVGKRVLMWNMGGRYLPTRGFIPSVREVSIMLESRTERITENSCCATNQIG